MVFILLHWARVAQPVRS